MTNWILELGKTFHMTPEILVLIPCSLVETYKYIEVSDVDFIALKQTGGVKIKMCGDNGKPFIDTLYNVILATDLCDQLFSIVALMNLIHT